MAIRQGSQESAQQSTTTENEARMFAITSSPYAVRRDSAALDASLIEVQNYHLSCLPRLDK